jgi:integral membrane protein
VTDPVRSVFRAVAIAEAVSWVLLLAAMYAKYVTESEPLGLPEGGVPVAGMVHGVVFIAFVCTTLVAWRRFGWSLPVLLVALLSSIVPLATLPFEIGADRRGLLRRSAVSRA